MTERLPDPYYLHWSDGQRLTEEEAFWARVDVSGECWEWTGRRFPTGYGGFKKKYAHRTAWEFAHGSIPKGTHICHHCDNPPCVRVDHLFAGTVADNMHDRDAKGRNKYGPNAPHGPREFVPKPFPSHCSHGHELTPANTRVKPNGRWKCRACAIVESRRWYRINVQAASGAREWHERG